MGIFFRFGPGKMKSDFLNLNINQIYFMGNFIASNLSIPRDKWIGPPKLAPNKGTSKIQKQRSCVEISKMVSFKFGNFIEILTISKELITIRKLPTLVNHV